MKNMNATLITSAEQLQALSQHFRELSKVDLPVDYLRRGIAKAFTVRLRMAKWRPHLPASRSRLSAF